MVRHKHGREQQEKMPSGYGASEEIDIFESLHRDHEALKPLKHDSQIYLLGESYEQ